MTKNGVKTRMINGKERLVFEDDEVSANWIHDMSKERERKRRRAARKRNKK